MGMQTEVTDTVRDKRRLIYCLDSGKVEKGAILKIISDGVLVQTALSDVF